MPGACATALGKSTVYVLYPRHALNPPGTPVSAWQT
jgi:hypothetical protein